MTDKLKKGELYKAFEKYNTQIQAILFLDPLDSKESYHKIDEALEVLHRRMEELIQKKPEVTEEFIGNKGRELFGWSADPRTIKECEDFIRLLVEAIPAKRVTVSEEFIEEKAQEVMFLVDDVNTAWSRKVENVQDFINSLLEEMPAKKIIVSEGFVEKCAIKLVSFIGYPEKAREAKIYSAMQLIREMFKETGMEVVEK